MHLKLVAGYWLGIQNLSYRIFKKYKDKIIMKFKFIKWRLESTAMRGEGSYSQ